MNIEQFVADRNAALLSLDRRSIEAFANKYGIALHPDEEIFWAGIHKGRTAIPTLPLAAREHSKHWLSEHGYRSEDDGDLTGTGGRR